MTRNPARFPPFVRLGTLAGSVGIVASVSWGSCSVYDESLLTQPNGNEDSSAGTNGSNGLGGTNGSGGGGGGEDSGGVGGTAGTDGSGGAGAAGGTAGGDGAACPVTAGPWWVKTTSHGCQAVHRPGPDDRPPASCEGENIPPIVLATSRIRLGYIKPDFLTPDENAWKEIGLDLDQSCTLSETCATRDGGSADAGDAGPVDGGDAGSQGPLVDERACKSGPVEPTDGLGCRDNMLGMIFGISAQSPVIGDKFKMTERNWNCALHRGEFSTIIKVSEYNGLPDDPRVRVDNYSSTGQQSLPSSWNCIDNINDWERFAPWPPTSRWRITRRSLSLTDPGTGTELPPSKYGDPNAYVRGGYLVAQLPPGTELWLNGERSHAAGFRNIIRRAVTVGKLVKATNGVWSIEQGNISGVTFPTDIVQAFREIGYCENFCGSYDTIVQYLNLAQDALTSTDEKLPDSPCDGISMGIEFTAKQVLAERADLVDSNPTDCPNPRDPTLPRQGCICNDTTGECVLPDAATDAGRDR